MSSWAGNVREWIRGEMQLYPARDTEPGSRFASPAVPGEFAAFVQFMPEDRARRVARNYFLEGLSPEEYELAGREERKKDLAEWLKEHGIGDDQ